MKQLIKTIFNAGLIAGASLAIAIKVLCHRLRKKPIIFILGTPSHSNLGDQAIAVAELTFLRQRLPQFAVVETRLVNRPVIKAKVGLIKLLAQPSDIMMGHGGGNMGDEYPNEEAVRQLIITTFAQHRVVIFPQTIFYKDTDVAQAMLAEARAVYARHPQLTLIGREQTSYQFLQQHFPKNRVLLIPDIVLSMEPLNLAAGRHGAMTCLRQDPEKGTLKGHDQQLQAHLQQLFGAVNVTDTMSADRLILTSGKRRRRLHAKWQEFARAEVVVTDRLHGMVFAYLTQTPCVVFSNYNYKVSGTYQWIKQLPFIEFCEQFADLEAALSKVVSKTKATSPDLEHYWKQLAKEIIGNE